MAHEVSPSCLFFYLFFYLVKRKGRKDKTRRETCGDTYNLSASEETENKTEEKRKVKVKVNIKWKINYSFSFPFPFLLVFAREEDS